MSDRPWVAAILPRVRNGIIRSLAAALVGAVVLSSVTPSLSAGTDVYDLVLEGGRLSARQAAELEKAVAADPTDLDARTRLLGYYMLRSFESDAAREARERHVMWIIENRPESKIAGLPEAGLDPLLNGNVFFAAKELWEKNVELFPAESAVLANAASFMLLQDRGLAESLFKQLISLEPASPEWKQRLAHLYSLDAKFPAGGVKKSESAVKALQQEEEAYALLGGDCEKFYALTDLTTLSFDAGDLARAADYAGQLLAMVDSFVGDWNYGNAIHYGHSTLGRVAAASGQKDMAAYHLLESARSEGSPQLNSFGPNMDLAKDLLRLGEKEAVRTYLTMCKEFWEMDNGSLDRWISEIDRKGTTDFQQSFMIFK